MLISGGKVIAIDSVNTSTATLSGDGVWQELGLNTSAVIDPINNKISAISGKLDNEIATRTSADNVLSAAIVSNSSKIDYLSGAVDYVSAELDAETDTRIEEDQFLSAAIDTKQHRLSAGDYIDITSGEDYDTISVTGLKTFTYFASPYGRHTSTEYFTFDGSALSANSAIGYFNLAVNYKVKTNNTCVDNYYSAVFNVNDKKVDTHYINGNLPLESHTFSKNVLNDAENNLYEIGFNKDPGIDVNEVYITCVGFMGEPDATTVGVLGANSDTILTFGNILLRA